MSSSMFARERKTRILSHLNLQGRATVRELALLLRSAESTIRKDLQDLEEQRQLERTHGGAVLLKPADHEPTWKNIDVKKVDANERIRELAVAMVRDGDTILLDASLTVMHIANHLRDRDVTAVTNSVAIASELSTSPFMQIVLLGGDLRKDTGALVGPFAEQMLTQMHVDILFLGASGFNDDGVTASNAVVAATKRAMMKTANMVVVVADHSKFGQQSLVRVCPWRDVSALVTDKEILDETFRHALLEADVAIYAPKSD